jgi:hypothetical protein
VDLIILFQFNYSLNNIFFSIPVVFAFSIYIGNMFFVVYSLMKFLYLMKLKSILNFCK